jgi:hypothetical protein
VLEVRPHIRRQTYKPRGTYRPRCTRNANFLWDSSSFYCCLSIYIVFFRSLYDKKITHFVFNSEIRRFVHKNRQHDSFTNKINSVRALTIYLFKICFNIMLSSHLYLDLLGRLRLLSFLIKVFLLKTYLRFSSFP